MLPVLVVPAVIRKIPSDKNFRMDVSALEKKVMDDQAAGMKPFAIIARLIFRRSQN
jgi:glutamate/tyrosine decarboxylase-like PLP-dependent enzyme